MGLNHLVSGAPADVAPDATAVPWRNASISLTVEIPVSQLGETWERVRGAANASAAFPDTLAACADVALAVDEAIAPYLGGLDSRLYLNYPVSWAACVREGERESLRRASFQPGSRRGGAGR